MCQRTRARTDARVHAFIQTTVVTSRRLSAARSGVLTPFCRCHRGRRHLLAGVLSHDGDANTHTHTHLFTKIPTFPVHQHTIYEYFSIAFSTCSLGRTLGARCAAVCLLLFRHKNSVDFSMEFSWWAISLSLSLFRFLSFAQYGCVWCTNVRCVHCEHNTQIHTWRRTIYAGYVSCVEMKKNNCVLCLPSVCRHVKPAHSMTMPMCGFSAVASFSMGAFVRKRHTAAWASDKAFGKWWNVMVVAFFLCSVGVVVNNISFQCSVLVRDAADVSVCAIFFCTTGERTLLRGVQSYSISIGKRVKIERFANSQAE